MRILLDTHVFAWAKALPKRLSRQARQAIVDPNNEVYVSLASAWELCIKARLGKLHPTFNALIGSDAIFVAQIEASGFQLLPIAAPHVFATRRLPLHHRDPFDRLLIAQALADGLTIVTHDPEFAPYGVALIAT